MILVINFYPLFLNIILFFIFFRIILLTFELVDPNFQNLKHGTKIGLHIFVFLLLFFCSGFYHYHFAYDVNDYYSEKSLKVKSDFIEKIDSLQANFQLTIDAHSSLDNKLKSKFNSQKMCFSLTRFGQKSHLKIPQNFYDVLEKIIQEEEIQKITFCRDSSFIFDLGNVYSSEYSDFEDKSHFTTHQLIYNPRGIFKKPYYSEMFIGSVDSILTPQWNYRIEKRWEYVW